MTDRSHNEPSSKPPVDLREAGRKGGKASGEACRRRKTRRLRDVLRDKIAAEPEAVADTLLRTSAGAVVAARIAGADRAPGFADGTIPFERGLTAARCSSRQLFAPRCPTFT